MLNSREVVEAAIRVALTKDREEEKQLCAKYRQEDISAAGVDFGGEYITSITKIIERAIVAAKREEDNARLEREIAERKQGAVSYEEYLKLKLKCL